MQDAVSVLLQPESYHAPIPSIEAAIAWHRYKKYHKIHNHTKTLVQVQAQAPRRHCVDLGVLHDIRSKSRRQRADSIVLGVLAADVLVTASGTLSSL